ncbi:MAG: hypothetical protein E6Q97_00840 [Desulfurellales bacterium]|nr:MAG: hypothetical protein E6Q97_00840 [Desulfurellales bacterium]
MKVEILRKYQDGKATIGLLSVDGVVRWLTLELPWRNNEIKKSCIPEGDYVCEAVSNRQTSGGLLMLRTFEVKNVKPRSGILFHIGNSVKDTEGCILLGNRLDEDQVLNSLSAFNQFRRVTEKVQSFDLKIRS